MRETPQAIPPDIYDADYYLHHRGGSAEFRASQGQVLCDSHRYALELAELKETDRVLDVGCGCGEISLNAAGVAGEVLGLDYSSDAIALANEASSSYPPDVAERVEFRVADIERFDFEPDHYDVVFFLDVIEHLYQPQIDFALARLRQTLAPGGRLIVHTWPNRWHIRYTYRLSYLIGLISGTRRPWNPRSEHDRVVHVAEQSPRELKNNLRRAGVTPRVFVRQPPPLDDSAYHKLYDFLHSAPGLRQLFCDHIWAVATK